MTRKQAKAKYAVWPKDPVTSEEMIDIIFNDFETKDCTGCKHKPYKKKDVYPLNCSECSRFYGDGYEPI